MHVSVSLSILCVSQEKEASEETEQPIHTDGGSEYSESVQGTPRSHTFKSAQQSHGVGPTTVPTSQMGILSHLGNVPRSQD